MSANVRIPKRVQDRLLKGLRKYKRIVGRLGQRDISEADTVTVIKDIFSDLFGYDKYTELTSEQQIRGTFCDLAVKVEDKLHYLVEIKGAGVSLGDNHLRQALNYGAHQGIEWIILTNAIEWRVYKLKFGKPIESELVFSLDFCELSPRSADDLERLFVLCRESISSDALKAFHEQAQIVNRYVIGEMLQSPPIVNLVRLQLKRLFDVKVTDEEIETMIRVEILKRDLIEGDHQKEATKMLGRATKAFERQRAKD